VEVQDPSSVATWALWQSPGPDLVVHAWTPRHLDPFRRPWWDARAVNPPMEWTSVTVCITRGQDDQASFTIEYGYDPVPIEDQDERAERWRTRHLPRGAHLLTE
jgi:hypothetical protein